MLYASALFAVALVYAVVVLGATVILWEYVAAPCLLMAKLALAAHMHIHLREGDFNFRCSQIVVNRG